MSLDKYVVGFVFGLAVGAAVASSQDAPRALEEQIKREERYVLHPEVMPLQVHKGQLYADKRYLPN